MPCAYQHENGEGCQFAGFALPPSLFSEGQEYCILHAPPEATNEKSEQKIDPRSRSFLGFASALQDVLTRAKQGHTLADLRGVNLIGSTSEFVSKEVSTPINFAHATFHNAAVFKGSRFAAAVHFTDAKFVDKADFRGTRFEDEVTFDRSIFYGDADFDRAVFRRRASLTGVQFSQACRFTNINPRRKITFTRSQFLGVADFSNYAGDEALAFRMLNFKGCVFSSTSRWMYCKFRDRVDFGGTTFVKAPRFFGSELHRDTNFGLVRFLDRSGEAAAAYGFLKSAMGQLRARDEEGLFNGLEQECKRKRPETPRSVRIISWLYGGMSNYGQSLARPLGWLLGVAVFFFALYLLGYVPWIDGWPDCSAASLVDSARFMVIQIVKPFSALGASDARSPYTVEAFKAPPLSLGALAAVQSVASLALIGLFLVVLRWRFKRD